VQERAHTHVQGHKGGLAKSSDARGCVYLTERVRDSRNVLARQRGQGTP
jgi:hypothetical protein